MGSGIAQVLAVAGCEVTCCDVEQAQLDRAAEQTRSGRYGLDRAVERGKLTPEDAQAAAARLAFSADPDAALAQADLVTEAVPTPLNPTGELLGRWAGTAPQTPLHTPNHTHPT